MVTESKRPVNMPFLSKRPIERRACSGSSLAFRDARPIHLHAGVKLHQSPRFHGYTNHWAQPGLDELNTCPRYGFCGSGHCSLHWRSTGIVASSSQLWLFRTHHAWGTQATIRAYRTAISQPASITALHTRSFPARIMPHLPS
jgi:hypothetical protein